MRSKDRIDVFISEFEKIWVENFWDLRFGQLMYNFMSWMESEKHRDPFFPEEEEMLNLFKEYAKSSKFIGS